MCGRVTHALTWSELHDLMQLTTEPSTPLLPRFNIAPTQNAPIVRGLEGGGRELVPMRWGLVPSWAPDLALGSRMINARCETVASKPAFRAAFKARRCLVPISGFYEWEARGAGAPKQPWYIHMAHAPGVMSSVKAARGREIDTPAA